MKAHPLNLLACALLLMACSSEPAAETTAAGGGGGAGGTGAGGGSVSCDDGTVCDSSCVDLDTDPNNCGSCGRTCVVPGAEASCVAGECALASCDVGYADCDADIQNGCEAAIACEPGAVCTTSCDSQGTLSCDDVCSPGSCQVPLESCNLIDDNCDGSCDEGAIDGCRIGVHRSSGPVGHFYATDPNEATSQGNTIEATNYFYLYSNATADLRPLFRCLKSNGKTLLTTTTFCDNIASMQATVGFIAPQQECGSVPLYRLHHAGSNNHFYTTSAAERDNAITNLGYTSEGEVGYVWGGP